MRQRFVSVLRIHQLAGRITALAGRADVYVGVALRDRAHGDKSAISGSHMLYIECDDPGARERVENFAYSPSMIVASGSPGHLHVYWRLRERASSAQVESTNRRLAVLPRGRARLRGHRASAQAADQPEPQAHAARRGEAPTAQRQRASRPAGADRQPSKRPTAETVVRPTGVAQPHRPRPRSTASCSRSRPAEYVRVLASLTPNRAGKVLCPFHQESRPSLQLYPDGTFYCFGRHSKDRACRKGGTIFDFAAARWGLGTRGNDFLELRRRLATTFGLTQPPHGGS